MTYENDFATIEDFAKALKKWRGNGWIFFNGSVAGKSVQLKTHNHTYMQIYRVDGANQPLSNMDCTVGQFNDAIAKPFRADHA